MRISSVVVGPFQENSYCLVDDRGVEAVLIDPGEDDPRIAAMVDEAGATLTAIWLTHGHLDHMWAVAPLCREMACVPIA